MGDNRKVTGETKQQKKARQAADDAANETVVCTSCGGETSTGIAGDDDGHVVCEKCGNQTLATTEEKK